MTLDLFEGRADIWRGGLTPAKKMQTVETGFEQLNEKLSGGGWPIGAITEILCTDDGAPPLWLVMPALSVLSRQSAWITWVAPPFTPYAPALHALGIELSRVMLVHARNRHNQNNNQNTNHSDDHNYDRDCAPNNKRKNDSKDDKHMDCWAIEQALKSGTASAVLGWLSTDSPKVLRRLQLAAESGNAAGFIFRPKRYSQQQSYAALRLCVDLHPCGLSVRILKCRGGFSNSNEPIRILFDQLPTFPQRSYERARETRKNASSGTVKNEKFSHNNPTSNSLALTLNEYDNPRPYLFQEKLFQSKSPQKKTAQKDTQRTNGKQTIDGEKMIAAAYKHINKNRAPNNPTHESRTQVLKGSAEMSINEMGNRKSPFFSAPLTTIKPFPAEQHSLSNGLDAILELFASHRTREEAVNKSGKL